MFYRVLFVVSTVRSVKYGIFHNISICLLVLFIIAVVFSVILPYLILFLDCHISYIIIWVIVSVNFLICLFVFVTSSMSRCCCGVQVFYIDLFKYGWKCFQIFCVRVQTVNRCRLPSFFPQ